jgi:hypothetical protein
MARRPVGIVLDASGLITICDDGTLWTYLRAHNEWHRLASTPGSPASKREAENAANREKREPKRAGAEVV